MLNKTLLLLFMGLGLGSEVLATSSADPVTFEVLSDQVVAVDPFVTQTILQLDACATEKLERITANNIGKVLRVTLDGAEITRALVQTEIRGGRIVFVPKDQRVVSGLSGKPPISAERKPKRCQ